MDGWVCVTVLGRMFLFFLSTPCTGFLLVFNESLFALNVVGKMDHRGTPERVHQKRGRQPCPRGVVGPKSV